MKIRQIGCRFGGLEGKGNFCFLADGTVYGVVRARTVRISSNAVINGELQYGTLEVATGARVEARFVPVFTDRIERPSGDLLWLSGKRCLMATTG